MRKREPRSLDKLVVVFIMIDSCMAGSSYLDSSFKALPLTYNGITLIHATPVAYLLHSALGYTIVVLLFLKLYFCFIAWLSFCYCCWFSSLEFLSSLREYRKLQIFSSTLWAYRNKTLAFEMFVFTVFFFSWVYARNRKS